MATANFFAGSKILHAEALSSLRGEDIERLGCLTKELGQFKISCLLARKLSVFHRGLWRDSSARERKGIVASFCLPEQWGPTLILNSEFPWCCVDATGAPLRTSMEEHCQGHKWQWNLFLVNCLPHSTGGIQVKTVFFSNFHRSRFSQYQYITLAANDFTCFSVSY